MRAKLSVGLAVAVLSACFGLGSSAPQAEAHPNSDYVRIYNPVADGVGGHNQVSAYWATTPGTEPPNHHVVYSSYGFPSDWSVDIFGPPGRPIVRPFGTRTLAGHLVDVTVVDIRPACASGNPADGGYVVTLEARDSVTNSVLGRTELAHLRQLTVREGDVVTKWERIGYTGRFRYSSCYQVTSSAGVHVHLEAVNRHLYSCYKARSNGAALTETTQIGAVGVHRQSSQRRC